MPGSAGASGWRRLSRMRLKGRERRRGEKARTIQEGFLKSGAVSSMWDLMEVQSPRSPVGFGGRRLNSFAWKESKNLLFSFLGAGREPWGRSAVSQLHQDKS